MKKLALIGMAASTAMAAALIQQRAISFRSSVDQVDDQQTVWQTDYGSYRRLFSHRRILHVHLHVVGETEKDFEALWFFFGKKAAGEGPLTIWGVGHGQGRLDAANSAELLLESPLTSGEDANYAALQIRDRSGVKPFGWAVALRQHDQIVAQTGSTPEMAELGRQIAETHPDKPLKPGEPVPVK